MSIMVSLSTYIIFSRTAWNEAPRLRHQVTALLLDAGHRVFFFDAPKNILSRQKPLGQVDGLAPLFVQNRFLIHHQFRVVPPLHAMNTWFVRRQITKFLRKNLLEEVTVFNFNYDNYFLREVFPKSKIVTIINDDFEAQSRLPFSGHITWALQRTCRMSDVVFGVSIPLVRRLSLWSASKLILPWSSLPYTPPQADTSVRTRLLFWGFLDPRLDISMLNRIAEDLARRGPQWKLMMVGPTQGRGRNVIERSMARHPNVQILGRHDLAELPLDTILAGVIPYLTPSSMDAVTLPNKAMPILARGIPLLISGMPAFIDAPFVRRLDAENSISAVIDSCIADFSILQPSIIEFLAANTTESRLSQLGINCDKNSLAK